MGRFTDRGESIVFRLRLTPRGGRDAIEGWIRGADDSEYLKVRVSAPPEDGKANAALVALLAKSFGIPKSAFRIVHGETARTKTIAIASSDATAQLRKFGGFQ